MTQKSISALIESRHKGANRSTSSRPAAPQWRGYTLEELRYRRAVSELKLEIVRERLDSRLGHLTNFRALGSEVVNSMTSSLLSRFSVVNIGMTAFRVARTGFKLYRFFRRR